MTASATPDIKTIADIPGWFAMVDQWMFRKLLSEEAVAPRGDLVEVGVYLGKSAALIGQYRRPNETFTVCDLFGAAPEDERNAEENAHSYATLSRERFEQNYLAIHHELPVVVQGLSSTILDHVRPGTARFVHVDASHLYAHVAVDIEAAREMLVPNGVVAFDDFRGPHTPGVAAAVWEAAATRGLHPICLTRKKLYATFDDPAPHRERLQRWLGSSRYKYELQEILGLDVVRIKEPPAKPAKAPAKTAPAGNAPGTALAVRSEGPASRPAGRVLAEQAMRRAARVVRAGVRKANAKASQVRAERRKS